MKRTKPKKNVIENLIKAGCFDEEGKTRNQLLHEYTKCEDNKPDHVYEKEVFGFYISSSPFDDYDLKEFKEYGEGDYVVTVVMPTKINVRYDRNGKEMAFITATNNKETIKMTVFSSIWKNFKCEEGQLILVKGKTVLQGNLKEIKENYRRKNIIIEGDVSIKDFVSSL